MKEIVNYLIAIVIVFAGIYFVSGCKPVVETETDFSQVNAWDLPVSESLKNGKTLWMNNCKVCHSVGLGGAPVLGNLKDWGKRLEKGKVVLLHHAINGFYGEEGEMPPRGGNSDLSDSEIEQIIDYIIEINNKYNK